MFFFYIKASDCYLTLNEQPSAISWPEQVTFDEMVMSTLYYTNMLSWNFNSATSLNQQSAPLHPDILLGA
jgi:hypothetical protein